MENSYHILEVITERKNVITACDRVEYLPKIIQISSNIYIRKRKDQQKKKNEKNCSTLNIKDT